MYLLAVSPWAQIHGKQVSLSLKISGITSSLGCFSRHTHTQNPYTQIQPQARNINLTLVCPPELCQPSPDTDYWLSMNAPKHGCRCTPNPPEDHRSCRVLQSLWITGRGPIDRQGRATGAAHSFLNVNDVGRLGGFPTREWSSAKTHTECVFLKSSFRISGCTITLQFTCIPDCQLGFCAQCDGIFLVNFWPSGNYQIELPLNYFCH